MGLEEESHIAEASFFLMNINVIRAEFARHPELLKKLTKWSLGYLNTDGRKVVPPSQDESVPRLVTRRRIGLRKCFLTLVSFLIRFSSFRRFRNHSN